MSKLFFLLPIVFFLCCLMSEGKAQDYDIGLGVRGGVAYGISGKYFVTRDGAGEIILTTRFSGLILTTLYEFHFPVFDTDGFYFFTGGGIHIGTWDTAKDYYNKSSEGYKVFAGPDAIAGLEYIFRDVPFSIAFDWKPSLHLVSELELTYDELSLSLRYLF